MLLLGVSGGVCIGLSERDRAGLRAQKIAERDKALKWQCCSEKAIEMLDLVACQLFREEAQAK